MEGPSSERPLRGPAYRGVRLGCLIGLGQSELAGFTAHVAQDELAVELGLEHKRHLPEPDARVAFRLLATDGAIEGEAQVVWTDEGAVRFDGEPCLAVGLRVVPSPTLRAQLDRLLTEFRYTVAVFERSKQASDELSTVLGREYQLRSLGSVDEALACVVEETASALYVGDSSPDECLSFLQRLEQLGPPSSVKVVAALTPLTEAKLLGLLELGRVFYFLRRPHRPNDLRQVMRRAVDAHAILQDNRRMVAELRRVNRKLARENAFLKQRFDSQGGFQSLVGSGERIRQVIEDLERVREADITLHLRGETGTGKELAARLLHEAGPRGKSPFVAFNCGGVTESLMHSILFGHKKGAFTGAARDHAGLFQQAHGGTLFLDEVSELSPPVQAALLRVLQEREVTPLGATTSVPVDVRVISASQRDLKEEVRAGRFREDLFFRLVVLTIELPPLRERKEDLPTLLRHFLALYGKRAGKSVPEISKEALGVLTAYDWPGNVRELENEVARLVAVFQEGTQVSPDLLSPAVLAHAARPQSLPSAPLTRAAKGVRIPSGLSFDDAVELAERSLIEAALAKSEGNLSRAAELLGVERSRLGKLRSRLFGKKGDGEADEAR